MRMTGMAMHVIRTDGFLALYNGLSASLCRQVRARSPAAPAAAAGSCPVPHTAARFPHADDIFPDSLWHL